VALTVGKGGLKGDGTGDQDVLPIISSSDFTRFHDILSTISKAQNEDHVAADLEEDAISRLSLADDELP
jgi:hypothetical protein